MLNIDNYPREKHAYGDPYIANASFSNNKFILKWWTSNHDEVIIKKINELHWMWSCSEKLLDELISLTSNAAISEWKSNDILCKKYAWYNVLIGFASSRAYVKGFLKNIRVPEWKVCPMCGNKFIESSLPYSIVRRLTINQIDFCGPCVSDILFASPSYTFNKKEHMEYFLKNSTPFDEKIINYICNLSSAIQRIPPKNYGNNIYDLWGFTTEQRLTILNILKEKSYISIVDRLYGSWLGLLIKAGLITNNALYTSRGIKCLAQDGHLCFSLAEKTIDDFLYLHGISHDKEPSYPYGKYRADFSIGKNTFVEYFGLTGIPEYDEKTNLKFKLCKQYDINLIPIFPKDLAISNKLEKIFNNYIVL